VHFKFINLVVLGPGTEFVEKRKNESVQ